MQKGGDIDNRKREYREKKKKERARKRRDFYNFRIF